MFSKRTNPFTSTILPVAVILCQGHAAHASHSSSASRLHKVPIDKSVCVVAEPEQHTYSLWDLPTESAFDPLENIQDPVMSADRDVDHVNALLSTDSDYELLPKSPPPHSGSTLENPPFFRDETAVRLPPLADFSTDGELGDVDNDGDLDMFVTNTDGFQNRLFINDGHGFFSDETTDRLPIDTDFTLDAELGDVDRDGDLDLFIVNNFAFQLPDCTTLSGQNRLLMNDGTGVFFDETEQRVPVSIAASTDARFVDVDGDGNLDIVITNSIRPGECAFVGGGQIQLLLNDGRGCFIDATDRSLPIEFRSDVGLDVGDIDGDNDFDIVVANPYGENRILTNDGAGNFTDQSSLRLPHATSSTRCVSFFDADSDGDLDIFWANDSSSVWPDQSGAQNRLLINNGLGVFSDETNTRLPLMFDVSRGGAACGDVDCDGDVDVIVGNNELMSEGRQNRLLINSGVGVFHDETAFHLPTSNDISTDVKFGDVNADGDLDAIVVNYGQQTRLLMGTNEPRGGPGEPEVLMGDVNGDGGINVLDVLAAVHCILGHSFPTEGELERADCDGDGQLNILDAFGVVMVILGTGECSP